MDRRDSIENVSLHIAIDYDSQRFHQISFDYIVNMYSRGNKNGNTIREPLSYPVRSQAVMYAYDYQHIFTLPQFHFSPLFYGRDYSKISAFPFNDFFWKYNDEEFIQSDREENDIFFNDSNAVTNKTLFLPIDQSNDLRLYEHPYIHWSTKRAIFREDMTLDIARANNRSEIKKIETRLNAMHWDDRYKLYEKIYGRGFKPYQFSIKLFLDINTYHDSTDILTATILDPHESRCYLLMDNQTHCFINILFDLCEDVRRMMYHDIKINPTQWLALYHQYEALKNDRIKSYLTGVESGSDVEQMTIWNNIVNQKLGIDNLKLFNPYKVEREELEEQKRK